jgi:hypothetical protein
VPNTNQGAGNGSGKHPVSSARTPNPDLPVPLAYTITPTGRPRFHLVALMDAAIPIRDVDRFRQARPVWDWAAEMISLAVNSCAAPHIEEVTRQLRVALNHENWLKN